ncbi:MAG TPA: cytochrome P450 [Streptosporangiaceae bacterium]|jgi:cytochrome P450
MWLQKGTLAILNPRLAQQVSTTNFADMTLPGHRLTAWLRPGRNPQVTWNAVRSAWLAQLRDPALVRPLGARMASRFDEVLGTDIDFVDLAQQASTRALLPVAIDGLSPRDTSRVMDFIAIRATAQTPAGPPAQHQMAWRTMTTHWPVAAIVHRELRARAAGRRPRRADLLDPLAGDLLRSLGGYQAVDSMLALLTALCGPPGAAAAGLLYELARHPLWARRLARELAPLDPAQLTGPSRAIPLTGRFIKEVLRIWTPQAFVERSVRTPIRLPQASLTTRNDYVLSPYLLHRDTRYWKDPDTFDPDRWLPGAEGAPATGACYMPFGWSPRACIGARLALAQLVALCQLMCTRYRIEVAQLPATTIVLHSGPVPVNFRGQVTALRRHRIES